MSLRAVHQQTPHLHLARVTWLLLAGPAEQNICPSNQANYREPASRDTTQDEVITTPARRHSTTQRYNGTRGQFGTSGAKEYLGLAQLPL